MRSYCFIVICLVLSLSGPAFGGGFVRYDGSARGNVLGAALTALADDPSALYYNPAGITQLQGVQAMVGTSLIAPDIKVETPGASTSTEHNRYLIPFGYVTYQINNKWWAGVGVFSRFGLGTEYNQAWPGRFNVYRAAIKEYEINPNIAFKINDKLSIAAGFNAMYFDLALSRKLPAFGPFAVTDLEISGDSWGWGWNVAMHYKPVDRVQLGALYRSTVKQSTKGAARTNPSSALYPTTTANGDVLLPDMLLLGLNVKATKTLSIGGGVFWTGWNSYNKFQINFDQAFAGQPTSTTFKNWKNVCRYLIGGEWKATDHWDLRLGYAYDEAPQPNDTIDYLLPENDRHMLSIGTGYHNKAWAVDLSYTYMSIKDRPIAARPAEGVLESKASGSSQLIGFNISRKF